MHNNSMVRGKISSQRGCRAIILASAMIMFMLFSVNFAAAAISDFGEYKQYQAINLIQICSDCTWVNISSVLYPNSTIAASNIEMTQDGYTFNYTLPSSKTSALGMYTVTGVGDESGIPTDWSYIFEVTSLGNADQTSYLFYIIMFALALIILIIGISIKNVPLTILGGFAVTFIGLYSLNNGIAGYRNLVTQWVSIIIMAFGSLCSIIAASEHLEFLNY